MPLNAQFRNPPPGANPPHLYDDPTTVPAADLAENPYWKRDTRRRYPRSSVVRQADVVALLTVGSRARPREDGGLIGDDSSKRLVQIRQEGEETGLAVLFEKDKRVVRSVLGPDGLPPFPSGLAPGGHGQRRYELSAEAAYPTE